MYLFWDKKVITDLSDKNINTMYADGYVFTRISKGAMDQTRSIRIDLSKFELSSENRRILRKIENVTLHALPLPHPEYDWKIGKMAKDFYGKKFGDGTFSANKIKELLTDETKSNLNRLLIYTENNSAIGYCIFLETDEIMHYCYPFYNLENSPKDIGLGMMTKAVLWAKEHNKKFVYLGSFQRPTDTYKLQFSGIEWFDGKDWQTDLVKLKETIK